MTNRTEYFPDDFPLRSQRGISRFHMLMLIFVWTPITIVIVGIIAFLGGAVLAAFGAVLGPLMLLFIAYAINRNLVVQRERRAMILLSYVENAVRLNLPLDKFLLAAEESEIGHTRQRLVALRSALAQGLSLGSALDFAVPEIPLSAIALLRREESIGQIQPALTRLIQRANRDHPTAAEDNNPFYRFYLFLVAIGVIVVGMGMMIFVVPKFRDIFKDFHTALPAPTQFVMDLADLIANTATGGTICIILIVIFIIYLGRVLQSLFTPNTGYFFPARFYQWLVWKAPLAHRLQRDRALADIFEFLADALRAGLPLHTAVSSASALHINYHMQRQLLRWRAQLDQGRSPADAAQDAGLPPLLVGFLQSAQSPRANSTPTSIPELFDFLSRYYRQRFSSFLLTLRSAAEPFIVLIMGAAVGFFVYSMYVPLVVLINSVADFSMNAGVL